MALPTEVAGGNEEGEEVFKKRSSLVFKSLQVVSVQPPWPQPADR